MKYHTTNNLFGKMIISSISFDEQEIIGNILYLHAGGSGIDCDPTYSIGNFYKHGITQPRYKFDRFPVLPDVVCASSLHLPLGDESCRVIMFDPPFLMGGETFKETKDGSCIIAKRFMQFKNFDELREMYSGSLKEFYRILKKDGIVVFKCQDSVSGGKQYLTHYWIINEAIKIGYYPKDMFILLSKNRMTDNRKQQHARKFHCYYLVFQKTKNKINYN